MDSPRNIYRQDVDFRSLALEDPDFAKFLKVNGQLDFNDPGAVRQLTKSLLRRDFKLNVELSDDRLCPPVPNRFNYVLWLQDLIDTTNDDYRGGYDPEREVVGLDIGTGASCIYPLLACAQRPKWMFVATDINDKNFQYAQENVKRNNLQSRIRVVKTTAEDPLIALGDKVPFERLQFTMCNPPFYESEEEMLASANLKHRPPNSACTGAPVEMVTAGGEESFVQRIIDESLKLRNKVQWYTSMLGKLSSVTKLIEKLLESGNQNWAVTEFVQGSKTRRWAIAWSWRDLRPTMGVARNISSIPKHLLPFPSEFTFHPEFESITFLIHKINDEMKSLQMLWSWDQHASRGLGFAMENVWSRQARRKRQHLIVEGQTAESLSKSIDESKAALGFAVLVKQTGIENVDVIVRWIKGFDSVLFESFCGMLKGKLEPR
ncbi:hypothetical protein CPSG_05903 [Coccidioides posadasii str. Silveira]|uniref:U6 small nuclear RNA (adenine-(43)-N(6))-methyltransferase n=2 Tax=Coccidioides posadasii TaxID=199306 RepID=E9D7V1_COCPS|nr:hypothetical protein CPSG_05903 [Coccidioides posadasii str. Silveira]